MQVKRVIAGSYELRGAAGGRYSVKRIFVTAKKIKSWMLYQHSGSGWIVLNGYALLKNAIRGAKSEEARVAKQDVVRAEKHLTGGKS